MTAPGLRCALSRLLLLAVALTLANPPATAQQAPPVPVVGVLMIFRAPNDLFVPSVRKGLADLGYVDGRNVRIEYRAAQGQMDQLPRLANELVEVGSRVIVAGAEPAARAAMQADSTIPIVIVLSDHDPVAAGLIESFSHPGDRVTGVFSRQSELVGKRLELLKETLPGISRVGVLWDSNSQRQLEQLAPAARETGVQLVRIELRAPYDFVTAFRAAKKRRAEAVLVLFSPAFIQLRAKVAAAALKNQLPTVHQTLNETVAGGLMSYGPSETKLFERSAYYIDRLLKGAKVNDLPVEQASEFRLVINLKTAKALGITIPESVLLRADEVIR